MKSTSTFAKRSSPGQPWSCLVWIFVIVGSQVSPGAGDIKQIDADSKCLRCICEASTGCNVNVGCYKPYHGEYSCGPFGISWRYWADAGSPKHDSDGNLQNSESAFENCVEDLFCAIQTVKNYINKFKKGDEADCDENNIVNCYDYIRMHILGGYNCSQSNVGTDLRYQKFQDCYYQTSYDIRAPIDS